MFKVCSVYSSVVDPDPHHPELLPGSGLWIRIIGPDPAKNERADFISQFSAVNSGLCVL